MIDFKEIVQDGEDWEAFARDFLSELGFTIEVPPDRGPDGGKDLLVTESLAGKLNSYPFRWLVSCKHRAHSGKSVSEADEPNILERVKAFNAEGFIGFYSTVPSSGLNNRLKALRDSGDISDYKTFDSRLLENHLVRLGYSKLLMRFFPNGYRDLKPLHLIAEEYMPLKCVGCGKDLLDELNRKDYQGVIALATKLRDGEDGGFHVVDVYWACKGSCDRRASEKARLQHGAGTGWEDISDLAIPAWYLRWVLTSIRQTRSDYYTYTDTALKKEEYFLMAMAQKVLREMTDKERSRVGDLLQIPSWI